ncbi:hypothetical protein PoB_001893500 [Plakobranchus ocellatus]|uniref:Uncharacterized protein n=1 Tax=Plakobranchus ocellatus TaxID=259542 RepID=A0AAV3ZBA1_9GAST|nr:hypothetical protein PoB_001893500 [Plakobranchus ocellatus]
MFGQRISILKVSLYAVLQPETFLGCTPIAAANPDTGEDSWVKSWVTKDSFTGLLVDLVDRSTSSNSTLRPPSTEYVPNGNDSPADSLSACVTCGRSLAKKAAYIMAVDVRGWRLVLIQFPQPHPVKLLLPWSLQLVPIRQISLLPP